MSLLQVENLTKRFGGLTALDKVELSVAQGTIHGLMGANGAGKTTLFSIIAGNQSASSGKVMFAGVRIDGKRPDQICRLGIARTFQIVRPFPGLSARETVETAILFGRDTPPANDEATSIAEVLLGECGLDDLTETPASSLTLAARKRLEVARALGTDPKLLLLDEVMAGLTPTEVDEMIVSLLAIKERMGLTILIIEHVMSALNRVSDCITVLHHGQKIAHGGVKDISENPDVLDAYFGADDDAGETA